jgi:hypothetical protein
MTEKSIFYSEMLYLLIANCMVHCLPWAADSYLVGQKILFSYRTQSFIIITIIIKAHYWISSCAISIQFISSHLMSVRYILILFCHLPAMPRSALNWCAHVFSLCIPHVLCILYLFKHHNTITWWIQIVKLLTVQLYQLTYNFISRRWTKA